MDGLAGTVGCGRERIEIERERVERGGQAWAAGCGQWALARASQDSSALCGGMEVWSGRKTMARLTRVGASARPSQHAVLDGHGQAVGGVQALPCG